MHDAGLLSRAERAGHLARQRDDLRRCELLALAQEVREVLPRELLHRQIRRAVVAPPTVDDSDDVRGVELARDRRLSKEASDLGGVLDKVGVQHLDGGGHLVGDSHARVHFSHSPAPDHLAELIGTELATGEPTDPAPLQDLHQIGLGFGQERIALTDATIGDGEPLHRLGCGPPLAAAEVEGDVEDRFEKEGQDDEGRGVVLGKPDDPFGHGQ